MASLDLSGVVRASVSSLSLIFFAGGVNAKEDAWLVHLGAATVRPAASAQVNRGTAAEGTLKFHAAETLATSVTYLFSEHWGVDLGFTAPAKHDMRFVAPFGALTVAHTDLQESMLSLQYHFLKHARIEPYLGAGVALTRYSSEKFTAAVQGPQDVRLKHTLGGAVQAGLDGTVGRHGLVNVEVRFADSDPSIYLDGQRLQSLHVDPLSIGLNAGWRF